MLVWRCIYKSILCMYVFNLRKASVEPSHLRIYFYQSLLSLLSLL